MKKALLLIALIQFTTLKAQEEKTETDVLTSPEGWMKERIHFPMGFAPSLTYSGFEELRFAPGWNNPESTEFWSYVILWYLNDDAQLTTEKISQDLKAYYDGLMGVDYTTSTFQVQANGVLEGEVMTFDKFFTKKDMTLNIKVRSLKCTDSGKYGYLFQITPSADKQVWEKLGMVLGIGCE